VRKFTQRCDEDNAIHVHSKIFGDAEMGTKFF